jgi:predicted CDP-diglyceride synthetase/phosphatidate cytidylyltransferase
MIHTNKQSISIYFYFNEIAFIFQGLYHLLVLKDQACLTYQTKEGLRVRRFLENQRRELGS